jgi:hypothetical protein
LREPQRVRPAEVSFDLPTEDYTVKYNEVQLFLASPHSFGVSDRRTGDTTETGVPQRNTSPKMNAHLDGVEH